MFKQKIIQVVPKKMIDFLAIIGIVGVGALIFYISDLKCLFKYTIGIPCPGCGLTRAWLAAFRMDFGQAFKWHPLFWLIPVAIVIRVFFQERLPRNKFKYRAFWLVIALVVISVYIIRMINLFPNQPPMDYNKQSLIYKWLV